MRRSPTNVRSYFLVLAAALVAALLAAPAAQAQIAWNASIPFSFTVADTSLPAGDYLVQEVDQNNPSTFALTNAERDVEVLFKTAPAGEDLNGNTPQLQFDVANGEAYLTAVAIPMEDLYRDVLPGDKYEAAKANDDLEWETKTVTIVVVD